MAEKIQGVIEVKDLERRLAQTRQFTHISEMDELIVNTLMSKEDENISIPTVSCFSQKCLKYREEMINLYNRVMGMYDSVNVVPDFIKVVQASVFDSFCYGYDLSTDSTAVYTMNPEMLGYSDVIDDKLLKKVSDENMLGRIKAFRFDYKYTPIDENTIDWSLIKHRKKIDDNQEGENIILVPMLAGVRFLALLKMYMSKGIVFMIKQVFNNGSTKIRCITEVSDVLKKFCDIPEVTEGLKSNYYPLDAYFYAPSIGAPSTSSMYTSINLFRISSIKRIKSISELKSLGIQKVVDPINDEIKEKAICRYLIKLQDGTGTEYEDFVSRLPHIKESGLEIRGNSSTTIYSYLHSLKNSERNEIFKSLPEELRDAALSERTIYKDSRLATQAEINDLQNLLKTKICKILIKKDNSKFSTITCSNNPDILASVYGEDYFNRYESFGVRVKYAVNAMEGKAESLMNDALAKYGINISASTLINHVKEEYKVVNEDNLIKGLYSIYGKTQSSRSENNCIFTRSLNATITTEGKVNEYYKNIDPGKIVRVLVMN